MLPAVLRLDFLISEVTFAAFESISTLLMMGSALTHLINKAKVEELKRLKAIDAFNEAYTLDPRPAKLVDMRIKELQEGREG